MKQNKIKLSNILLSEQGNNHDDLTIQLQKLLQSNGFEVEIDKSYKSESEYINVIFRDSNGYIDYRIKIRISLHQNLTSYLADVNLSHSDSLEDAVNILKKERVAFKNLKLI